MKQQLKRSITLASATFAALCGLACVCGGAPGEQNRLVFGSSVRFEGVDSMTAPVAAGSKLLVALEAGHSATAGANATALDGVTLRAQTASGATVPVTTLAPGRFSLNLDAEGAYRLLAVDRAGRTVDTFTVNATALDSIEIDDRVEVESVGTREGGARCTVTRVDSLRSLVLRENQRVRVVTRAAGRTGQALAGVLDLEARASHGAAVQRAPASLVATANAFTVAYPSEPSARVAVQIREARGERVAEAQIATAPGLAPVECDAP